MSQQLLHRFNVLVVGPQKIRKGMTKRVPTELLGDADLLGDGLNPVVKDLVWPYWLFAPLVSYSIRVRGKDVIGGLL